MGGLGMWVLYTVKGYDHEGYDKPDLVGVFLSELDAQTYATVNGLVYTEKMYPKTPHVHDGVEVEIEEVKDFTKGAE